MTPMTIESRHDPINRGNMERASLLSDVVCHAKIDNYKPVYGE